ncbi:hypothetical protein ACTA71_009412 [Dictyostelium dimigraforme]
MSLNNFNDFICCNRYPQSHNDNKNSIDFILNNSNNVNSISIQTTTITTTNRNKNTNPNSNSNTYTINNFNNNKEMNVKRRYFVIDILKSIVSLRNQPYNNINHTNAVKRICGCRNYVSDQISKLNSLNLEATLMLDKIQLTSIISDCVFETFILNSFQCSLLNDIDMFSKELGTINIPNKIAPTPALPPQLDTNTPELPLQTIINSPNQISPQNQSQTTTPNIVSQKFLFNNNNNNNNNRNNNKFINYDINNIILNNNNNINNYLTRNHTWKTPNSNDNN